MAGAADNMQTAEYFLTKRFAISNILFIFAASLITT